MPGDALDVFISYSQEDETLRRELEERLACLKSEGLVHAWHQRRIGAGEAWRGWIDRDLKSADLILLMVSEPFLASEYCRDSEIKHALMLQAAGHAKVIPIIARPCDWRAAPFAKLATLPQGLRPVTEWHSRESAWQDVAEGIREVATRLIAARLESTAEFRIAVRSPIRRPEPPAEAPPPQEISAAGASRRAILGGSVAVLAALAALLVFVLWRPRPSEEVAARGRPAALEPRGSDAVRGSTTATEPEPVVPASAPASQERPPAPPPHTAVPSEVEPEPTPPHQDQSPEEPPLAVTATAPEEPSPDAEPAAADVPVAPPPEPAAEPPGPESFERALGILAAAGAEAEGKCLAVLVGDDLAVTSGACAQASTVIIMGGNALTATRDEIFDLVPRPPSQARGVEVVRLLQGLGEVYGFVATRPETGFDHRSLSAYYVEASAIRQAVCIPTVRLTAIDPTGGAYVEDGAFDRYVGIVEQAADEAIQVAGSEWAALLPEALDSSGESLDGFVCDLPARPPGNLVFSAGGRVLGIGYPCEPFDRLEPEVRDSLPDEVRQLDLDCIAMLGEIRERLGDARSEVASP